MKKILLFLFCLFVACSAKEGANTWISNLLSLQNANFIVDNNGTITLDGLTYVLTEVKSGTTAVYSVFEGEGANKGTIGAGFTRFDIVPEATKDSRITEPLVRYQIVEVQEEAMAAAKIGAAEVHEIPYNLKINALNNYFAISADKVYAALDTNGPNIGSVSAAINDSNTTDVPPIGAGKVYFVGYHVSLINNNVTPAEGFIYKKDVKIAQDDLPSRPIIQGIKSYYLSEAFLFIKAVSTKRAVYRKLQTKYYNPGGGTFVVVDVRPRTPYTATSGGSDWVFEDDPQGRGQFFGVEIIDGIAYFCFSPSGGYFSSADSVSFNNAFKVAQAVDVSSLVYRPPF